MSAPPLVDAAPETGLSAAFNFDRDALVNSQGVRYRDFKQSLRPNYARVWFDIFCGYLALALIAAGVIGCELYLSIGWAVAAALVGWLCFGYVFAYLALFIHEAGHFLIAPTRARNDFLANLFLGSLVGQEIKAYRVVHFGHHRHLGMPEDTERTYFDPLNVRFFLELLTGYKALKVLRQRGQSAKENDDQNKVPRRLWGPLLWGLMFHATVVLTAAWFGLWFFVAAWVIGMGIGFPLFAAVRQLLEHRDDQARDDVDYRKEPHGVVVRLFGDGPIASTLGGAGFNRHLLHHWEPQISYTRLKDLEAFLLDTEIADELRARKTTYGTTFLRLLRY